MYQGVIYEFFEKSAYVLNGSSLLALLVIFNKCVVKFSLLSIVTSDTLSCLLFLRVYFHTPGQK